ncbi:hypothetical protein, partial [Anaerotignum lactatifermentans]|uniref:hypothetical protein n=1 Tax=Anaerotignum lactatifermentans TaxID=160404 RepID=UPI001A9AED25
GVYRLFGTPFGIKITPLVIQYIILSNKWGAVQKLLHLGYFSISVKYKAILYTPHSFLCKPF